MLAKKIYHIIIFVLLLLTLDCQRFNTTEPAIEYPTINHHQNFPSQFVSARNVDVLLPPGYTDHPDRQFPVLVMHDGQMLFDSTTTWNRQEWGVDETLGKLVAEGKVEPFIVVAVWNTGNRFIEYMPRNAYNALSDPLKTEFLDNFNQEPLSNNYLRFLTEELIPFVRKEYRTLPGKEHLFIAGSSMGGLISLYAICEYPEVFGGAACLSTHWPIAFDNDHPQFPQALIEFFGNHLPDPKDHKIYFDYGTATLDSLYKPHQMQMDAKMIARGYIPHENWLTREFPGADHSEQAWNDRLHIPLEFLFGK